MTRPLSLITAGGSTPNYIEDVFSTDLYTGTGAARAIVNGIDLSTVITTPDTGPNSISATPTADVTTDLSSPFSSVAYSAKFFDSTSNGIELGQNYNLLLDGDFTIEAWLYQTDTSAKVVIGSDYATGTNSQVQFNDGGTSGAITLYSDSGGAYSAVCSSSPVNTWFHLALVRSGAAVTVYLNGVSQGAMGAGNSGTPGYQFSGGSIGALRNYNVSGWVGNMSCFRIVNGTAVYTTNFSPSTTPLTAIANTALLLQLSSSRVGGRGGLVWVKSRSSASAYGLYDTDRGETKDLVSTSTAAQTTQATGLTSFSSDGFSIGALAKINTSAATYVSWTFRKQPKFFDTVVYKGTGANRTIAHNLGSVPGCIIVKRVDAVGDWQVYHRGIANTEYTVLNTNVAKATGATRWNSTTPTSTVFSVGTDASVNASGGTYVAYIFAHNAGGFGLTGLENVISCGAYFGNGSATGPIVTLGYEPQWLMIKNATGTGNWLVVDNMRGMPVGFADPYLEVDVLAAEASAELLRPTPDGFQINATFAEINTSASVYIYVAIRRGPMKVPTDATKVFGLNARTGTGVNATVTGGQIADAVLLKNRGSGTAGNLFISRATGANYLSVSNSAAEVAAGATVLQANPWDVMDGVKVGTTTTLTNASGNTFINYLFKRSPGFFDQVCYTGTGANRTIKHNLTVVPELIIFKSRSAATTWQAYSAYLTSTEFLVPQTTAAKGVSLVRWNSTAPTSTVFSLGTGSEVNGNAATFVAYLFASCPGVSKLGSYTGTATTQQINCGFTNGARFVLIKRTDAVGSWYIWDSARGITSGNDPYILLETAVAEVTNTNYIDAHASGFTITSTAPAGINASGGNYIYLAIA